LGSFIPNTAIPNAGGNGLNGDEDAAVVTLLGDIHQPTDLLETAIQQDVEPAPEERARPETNGSGAAVRARRSTRENIFEAQVKPLNPIEALLEFFRANPKPQQARDLLRLLPEMDVERLGGRRGLENTLERLVREGQLVQPKRHTFALPKETAVLVGRFDARGYRFGFLAPETPGLPDLFIPAEGMFYAWHGDRVVARVERRKGEDQPRGRIIRILERAREQVVGTLEYSRGYAILRPDETRLPRTVLLPDGTESLRAGARINVKLYWPELTGEDEPYGQIIEVLGDGDSPEVETRAVVAKFELRDAFPEPVQVEAERIPLEIPESALEGRSDLRAKRVFTIDGRDAKDFDDAIHIEPLQNGHFLVGIHVADVSHYVPEGSVLDVEARERATSVYLPGKVLPMLPERLSNGVCSLVPDEDRLTVSVLVEITADGEVVNDAIVSSVIHSKARLTYDEVQAFSEAKSAMPDHARDLEGDLHLLLKLTTRMRERRFREGSLDFRLREVKVDIQPDGSLTLIPIREETARGLIEDLMLTANKIVARHLHTREIPALYRVHEEPSSQRFQEVVLALGKLGISVPGGKPTPQAYQEMLANARGTALEGPVNTLLLRSMRQAKYSHENKGHFGLAFSDYLHFTSPIRRYPDLIVHRVLKAQLARKMGAKRREVLEGTLPSLAEHSSERERNAAEAERDLTKYYQARWALERVGQVFKAHVSGVTPFGLFVALENGVEGLVRLESLTDDQYALVEDGTVLRGRTGRQYRLGSPIRIRISGANPVARQIDFVKEMDMNGKNTRGNRPQPRNTRGPQQAATQQARAQHSPIKNLGKSPSKGNDGRRVVVLSGRPKGEHSRPVRVTARKLYFGEWSRANMDGEGAGEPRTESRSETTQARPESRAERGEHQSRHRQRPRQGRLNQQRSHPQPQAEIKSFEPSAAERNAQRAQRGPAEGRLGEVRPNAPHPNPVRPSTTSSSAAPSSNAGISPRMRFAPIGAQPAQPANATPAEGQAAGSSRRRRRRRR
jgi:ribonuclease R